MIVRAALLASAWLAAGGCLLAPARPAAGTGDGGLDDGGDGGATREITQTALIKIPLPGGDDQAGTAVALSGDGLTLAIGVPFEDGSAVVIDGVVDEEATNAGAVHVFVYDGVQQAWVPQAYLKAFNAQPNDRFGTALALSKDGSTLVVGAPGEASDSTDPISNAATGAGAAFVFRRDGFMWSQQAYLKASNPDAGDGFGTSVALSANGDRLVVGAPFEDSASETELSDDSTSNAGAAYVFSYVAGWGAPRYVKADVIGADDTFGTAVAIAGDGLTLVVGAPGDDGEGNTVVDCGAVSVFAFTTAPTFVTTLRAPTPMIDTYVGAAVALSRTGDRLLVGATGDSSAATGVDGTGPNTVMRSGAAFLLERPSTTWEPVAYVKASNTGFNDQLGTSVALAQDAATFVLGAPGEASSATGIDGDQAPDDAINAGAAYLFTSDPLARQRAYIKAADARVNDAFGASLAISDGGDTIAIGAPREDQGATTTETRVDSGAVYVFRW